MTKNWQEALVADEDTEVARRAPPWKAFVPGVPSYKPGNRVHSFIPDERLRSSLDGIICVSASFLKKVTPLWEKGEWISEDA